MVLYSSLFFFFNDTATTEIYTLSLHDALPISDLVGDLDGGRRVLAAAGSLSLPIAAPRRRSSRRAAPGRRARQQGRELGPLQIGSLALAVAHLRLDSGEIHRLGL